MRTPHRPARRRAAGRAGVVALALLGPLLVPAPSNAAGSVTGRPGDATRLVGYVQHARADRGLPPLRVCDDLTAVATRWARRMAAYHDIAHDPDLRTAVHGWRVLGENVGVGPDVASLHSAFMDSPGHRANVLDRDFADVGVGVAAGSDGRVYVVEDFRRPLRPATAAAAVPARTRSAPPAPPPPRPAPTATAVAAPPTARPAPPAARPSPAHRAADLRSRRLAALGAGPRPADPVAMAVGFAAAMAALGG